MKCRASRVVQRAVIESLEERRHLSASDNVAAPQAVITAVSPQDIIAGQAVHVQALNSTLVGDTPLTAMYQWDFGDTTPSSSFDQLAGWNAAHVYNVPGEYVVALTITDTDGQSSTATMQVNVSDASGIRTLYVSTSGNDANDGLTPETAIASTACVQSLLGPNTQVLFEAGDTFTMSTGLWINCNNVMLGSYGTGAQPTLMWTGGETYFNMIASAPGTHDLTINGLTFDSIYDTDTVKSPPTAIYPYGNDTNILNNTFLNITTDIDLSMAPDGVLVQNNTSPLVTGLRAYFIWAQGSDITVLGNTAVNSTCEHILRVGGAERMNVSYNNFTNQDTNKDTINVQVGEYFYGAHNTLSGGPASVGPLNRGDLVNDPVQYPILMADHFDEAVFEDNTLFAPLQMQPGASDIVFRGNVAYIDNGTPFYVLGYDSDYQRGVVNATITGNTAVDNGITGGFITVTGPASGLTLTNNLFVAPNLLYGDNGTSPVTVDDNDLSSFSLISGNVWPVVTPSKYAKGGENFVGQYWQAAYVTPDVWNAMPQVAAGGGDQFESVALPADYQDELAVFNATGQQLFAPVPTPAENPSAN